MYNYPPQQPPQPYPMYNPMMPPPYAMPKAGFWIRFAAYIIDSFIVGIIVNILVWIPLLIWFGILSGKYGDEILARCGSSDFTNTGCPIGDIIGPDLPMFIITLALCALIAGLFSLFYFVIGTAKGATLGKKAFGLRIIKLDGSKPGVGTALLRVIIGYFISSLVFYLGFIWIGFDPNKQGWHDKISNTYVIKV
jgi:uncharacterized RDD family membrane protein YckC